MGVAGPIPVGVFRVGFGWVRGSDEGVLEDFGAEFGGEEGEEGGGELGVYVGAGGYFVYGCWFGGVVEGAAVADVGSGSHRWRSEVALGIGLGCIEGGIGIG